MQQTMFEPFAQRQPGEVSSKQPAQQQLQQAGSKGLSMLVQLNRASAGFTLPDFPRLPTALQKGGTPFDFFPTF